MKALPGSIRVLGRWVAAATLSALLAACGGGGDGDPPAPPANANAGGQVSVPGSNVLAVHVDGGTDGSSFNAPFVTLTVCQPGTSVCQEIDHVLVDTGSSGLRIAASALPDSLRQALPAVPVNGGAPAGQCAHFASGFSWGSVRKADVRMGGETAAAISIQVVNDPEAPYASVPADCSSTGANIGAGRGAKGILGVGLFTQDCGLACQVSTAPHVYFACAAGTGCTSATIPVASQVSNPVASLPVNNNGVVLVLPPVGIGGAAQVTGALVLGIGTQDNNRLGSATVLATNSQGYISTVYKGVTYPNSFLDSGSNGLFFTDASLPRCGDFYCPPSPTQLTATNIGANGATSVVTFPLDSIAALPASTKAAHVGGDTMLTSSFDWGLPFFFGRTVFVARAGASTPYGAGPWWAY